MKKRKNKKSLNLFKIFFLILCMFGILKLGSLIFVRYFFNERLTKIPNVLNLSENDAKKYLKKAGLKVKVNYSVTEQALPDTVYIQFPEAGKEIKINRLVQIWVNSGKSIEIPNVIGMELLDARPILEGQNIQIDRIDYQPSNEKYNTIIGVYPEPGSKLEVNQKITLLVSSQKISDPSNMPNLIGLDVDNAKVLLGQIGLVLGNISYSEDPTLPVGSIISTNPKFGAKVRDGEKINLVINKGATLKQEGPSVEDIINQTNKDIQNKEIENIINETLNRLENGKSNKSESGE